MTPEESTNTPTQTATASVDGIKTKDLLIPISIAIAGAFIGIGLYFGGGNNDTLAQGNPAPANPSQPEQVDTTSEVNPVTESDWIKGDLEAPIKIVEFSDFDCPFCSRFHDTMNDIVAESNGQVAWVYRHFPLDQLHPQARAVSLASECVGAQGGQTAFWQFTDSYFSARGARDDTPHGELIPRLVSNTGVDQTVFTECFENGTYADAVQADFEDAVASGGRGTPWSILIGPSGKTYPINGAQPKQAIQQIINLALQEA
jgi:protein-disulfide isomerase